MPQLQTLVLNDRENTPVAHTFVPRSIKGDVGMVVNTTGVPVGEKRFTLSLVRNQTRIKCRLTLVVPVVVTETVNGVSTPKVVRENIVDATFSFSVSSTEQERKNLVGMFMNSLDPSKALVNDTLVKTEGVY